MRKSAWITWEIQPRNRSVADFFDADFYEIIYKNGRFERYIKSLRETFFIFGKGYDVIFVQNPSIILSFFSVIINFYFKKTLVIDAHNAGVRPFEGKYSLVQSLNFWILRNSTLVLITNSKLKSLLESKSIDCEILPDPLPKFDIEKIKYQPNNFVFVICSWAKDEPIEEYLEVAKLNPNIDFYFSGNYKKYFNSEYRTLPINIKLLGFIDRELYEQYLLSCLLSIDLTLRDDCLVCGAYESISLNKKVIVTDNLTNRELFGDAVLYSEPNVRSINTVLNSGLNTDMKIELGNFKKKYNKLLEEKKAIILKSL